MLDLEKYPILDKFYLEEPFLTPKTFLENDSENIKRKQLLKDRKIETAIIIFASNELKEKILSDSEHFFSLSVGSGKMPVVIYKNCIVTFATIGGAHSAATVEEFSYFGIKNFLVVGSCGLLDNSISSSFALIVEKAIRDEGTSYHYLEPSLTVDTDKYLSELLEKTLSKNQIESKFVTTWTTDAFYRETKSLIEKRKRQGASVVEMESASFAAACKKYDLRFAQLLYFTDGHSENQWEIKIEKENKKSTIEKLFNICVEVAKEIKWKKN